MICNRKELMVMKRIISLVLVLLLAFSACSAMAEEWTCPGCGKVNQENFCTDCGTKRPGAWTCPGCGRENYTAFCGNCGTAKPDSDAEKYPLPAEYQGMIVRWAREYQLDPALVAAVIKTESNFAPPALDPAAEAGSNYGAIGLMQLTPATLAWIAGRMDLSFYTYGMLYDPETNIRIGCWYLSFLSDQYSGDAACIAAAYHVGQGQVNRWLADSSVSEDGRTIKPERLPEGSTKQYVKRVLEAYSNYSVLYDWDSMQTDTAMWDE